MAFEFLGKNIEKTAEFQESSLKEIPKEEKILYPNTEIIRTQSLESVKELNHEIHGEYRPLTQEEATTLQAETNMSSATLSDCTINNIGTIKLRCINEDKADIPSAVPYIRYTIDIKNYEINVVMPEFPDVLFETTVPEEMYCADDYNLFKHCTEELQNALSTSPELCKQFNMEQLEQIMDGAPRIKGLTWHHGPECGNMQLVPTKMHSEYRHTGGKAIWGGGRC